MEVNALVIHDLPDDIAAVIGRVIVVYSRTEESLKHLLSIALGLQKPEARLALQAMRPDQALTTLTQILGLRHLQLNADVSAIKSTLEEAKRQRDSLAHGIWLRHPDTGETLLRLSKGHWDKAKTNSVKISRAIYPEAMPYTIEDACNALEINLKALSKVDAIGMELDLLLVQFPDRFPVPVPLSNPKGQPPPKRKEPQRPKQSSQE